MSGSAPPRPVSGPETAYGYARVSTKNQAAHGISLEAQEAEIRQYCKTHQVHLLGVERDAGLSGTHMRRAGLQSLLAKVEGDHPTLVVATAVDRVGREPRELSTFAATLVGAGTALVTLHDELGGKKGFDSRDNPQLLPLLALFAKWQRDNTSSSTKSSLRRMRNNGKYPNHAPFGFNRRSDASLAPNPEELATLRYILDLAASGASASAIAATLNREGKPTKKSRIWYPKTVRNQLLHVEEQPELYETVL